MGDQPPAFAPATAQLTFTNDSENLSYAYPFSIMREPPQSSETEESRRSYAMGDTEVLRFVYPNSIMIEPKNLPPSPPESPRVSRWDLARLKAELKKELEDELREKMKLEITDQVQKEVKEERDKADEIMKKLVDNVVGPIGDQGFAMKNTPLSPQENLNTNEANLIRYFIRNPGTGPFTLLVMLIYNGGLLSEPTRGVQLSWRGRMITAFTEKLTEVTDSIKPTEEQGGSADQKTNEQPKQANPSKSAPTEKAVTTDNKGTYCSTCCNRTEQTAGQRKTFRIKNVLTEASKKVKDNMESTINKAKEEIAGKSIAPTNTRRNAASIKADAEAMRQCRAEVEALKDALVQSSKAMLGEHATQLKEESVKKSLFFINSLASGHIQFNAADLKAGDLKIDAPAQLNLNEFSKFAEGFAEQEFQKLITDFGNGIFVKIQELVQFIVDFFQNFMSKDGVASDYEQLSNTKIVSAWQLAIVPFLMLWVQFAYVFFVWYEAYENYHGGLCPGYQSGPPHGALVQIRILSAFIGGYFCVRVTQQFMTFVDIAKGDNMDPNVHKIPSQPKSFSNLWGLFSLFRGETLKGQVESIVSMLCNIMLFVSKGEVESLDIVFPREKFKFFREQMDKTLAKSIQCCPCCPATCFGSQLKDKTQISFANLAKWVSWGDKAYHTVKGKAAAFVGEPELQETMQNLVQEAQQEAMKRYLLSLIDQVVNLKGMCPKEQLTLLGHIEEIEMTIDTIIDSLGPADIVSPDTGPDTSNKDENGTDASKTSPTVDESTDQSDAKIGPTEAQQGTPDIFPKFLMKDDMATLKNRRYLLEVGGTDSLPLEGAVPVGWRSVKWSWIYPFFLLDCFCALALMLFVFLANLYIVFVDGVSSRDMILNVVLLDFIYEQLPKYKTEVFGGPLAKNLLYTLKATYSQPPKRTFWKYWCRIWRSATLNLIIALSFISILVCSGMIIFGPVCKPGAGKVGTLPTVEKGTNAGMTSGEE